MRALVPALVPALVLAAVASTAAPGSGAVPVADVSPEVRVLVTLDERVPDVAAAARVSLPAGGRLGPTWSNVLKGYGATVPASAVPALQRAPGVVRVEPDPVLRTSAVQPTPPSGLDRVDERALPLDGAYSFDRTGSGVTAYVVDTGIRRSHTDVAGRARTGFDAVTPGGTADDCDGHGTHVAGTVGGTRFGIAKEVGLSAVRVLGCDGTGFGSDLLEGLDFIVRDHAPGAPAVAVLSLGGETTSTTVDDAVRRVVADGVTVSVAAGNAAVDACTISPARVPEVLTVGASDPTTDARAFFSNTGDCLDLYAPGVRILSAGHTSDTATLEASGTSMAAPHVAGAAALVLEGTPSATPAAVVRELLAQATPDVITDARSRVDDLLYTAPLPAASLVTEPSPSPSPSPTAEPSSSPSPSSEPTPAPTSAAPTTAAPAPPAAPEDVQGRFTPLRPARVLDSRDGTGGVRGRLEPGRPVELQVAGRGGVPPTGVTAVALNVTVTGPQSSGHLTVFPAGQAVPVASNLNHVRGQTVANLTVTGVSRDGRVALVSNAGTPHVVADVVGYYSDTLGGSRSTAVTPARLLDTRSGLGGSTGRLAAGQTVPVQVAGRGGVPSSGVTAAVVNVTAANPEGSGHLTVFPGGQSAPEASSLNFQRGTTVPNLVVVGVDASGVAQVRAHAGSPHVLVDVVGYYGGDARSRFVPVAPQRLLDTRDGRGRIAPGSSVLLDVAGRGPIPSLGVTSVLLNVTATGASESGHLTIYPATAELPVASNVNYRQGQTVPNLVLSAVTVEDGKVRIRSNAGSPHVVVDVVGYTTAASGP